MAAWLECTVVYMRVPVLPGNPFEATAANMDCTIAPVRIPVLTRNLRVTFLAYPDWTIVLVQLPIFPRKPHEAVVTIFELAFVSVKILHSFELPPTTRICSMFTVGTVYRPLA